MATPNQLRLVHIASRQLALNEPQYRAVLQNTAGVESAKELDNVGIEDVMAVFEDLGFRQTGEPEDYWRSKVQRRGAIANERLVRRIELSAASSRYCLPALCEKFSRGRTQVASKLTPQEAYQLIEMLKASNARGPLRDAKGNYARLTDEQLPGPPAARGNAVKEDRAREPQLFPAS
jgi:Protein of unknown function (DUF1018)